MTAATGRRSGRLAITVHLDRDVGLEVQRLAGERGVSLSACAAALLADALQGPLERHYAALVQPVVERTVREALYAHLERLGDLAFRAALDSDETRRLVMALLINAAGTERARALRREAHSAAWQRLGEPMPDEPREKVGAQQQEPRQAQADGVCQASPTRS